MTNSSRRNHLLAWALSILTRAERWRDGFQTKRARIVRSPTIVCGVVRALGVECKKQEVYLAFAEDGELVDEGPQRLQVPAVHEETLRLQSFLDDFRRLLAEKRPDIVRILQPESIYEAKYSELAPRAALETLIRLACSQAGVAVEVLHRATARSRTGFGKGKLDVLISANVEPVGRYWNQGRKYAAVAALAEEK